MELEHRWQVTLLSQVVSLDLEVLGVMSRVDSGSAHW